MNTPVHLIIGAAAFGKPGARIVTWAALAGSLLPDMSLFLMAGVSLFLLDIPAREVFGELYFSDAWQQVFAIDNSIVLWGIACGLAIWRKIPWLIALCSAVLLHLVADFLLHNSDARMQLWPLTDWKFFSPVSYWESARGGNIVGVVELIATAVLGVYLLRVLRDLWLRIAIGTLVIVQFATSHIWHFVF